MKLLAGFALVLSATHHTYEEAVRILAPPNTSASPRFTGTSNGNLSGATNVSKVNVHTMLYAGHTTKILAHYLPWWGPTPRGIEAHYRSDDTAQATRTFSDMRSRGIDGLVVDWYGRGHFTDTAWQASMPVLTQFPDLTFSIMMDSGTYRWNRCPGCDVTQTIIYQLDYISRTYLSSRQYLRYLGRPIVFEFGFETVGKADWDRIQSAYPQISWIHIHKRGFDQDRSGGAFLWIDPPQYPTRNPSIDLSQSVSFYRYAHTEAVKVAVGAVAKGFDDSLAPWAKDQPRYIPQSCGATWLDTFKAINDNFSATKQLPFLQLITWNDYEEGTALESGIDNCANLSAHVDGHALIIQLTHSSTIDHLELYREGTNHTFRLLSEYPPQTSTIQLGTHDSGIFFVKAVGKPFFKNILSRPIAFEAN